MTLNHKYLCHDRPDTLTHCLKCLSSSIEYMHICILVKQDNISVDWNLFTFGNLVYETMHKIVKIHK